METHQKIKLLYDRAGFGLRPIDWAKAKQKSIAQHIKELLSKPNQQPLKVPKMDFPAPQEFRKLDQKSRQALLKQARKLTLEVNANWIERLINPQGSDLLEKMILFWHGHFACESKFYHFAAMQHNTLRKHALGNFRDLVLAISKDAAMIMYLNNQQNRKKSPNENYARELMELFTIGRGNYTENDIKEAARAFTGWFTDRRTGEFKFSSGAHDYGSKVFMGKQGNFNGEDIIDILLQQKNTAEFIAGKVYRFFVNETQVNSKHIKELASVLYDADYDIKTMMKHLLEADWFYDAKNIGAKIKSPVELLVNMARVIQLESEDVKGWLFPQRALGQVLFKPPNVAGWPGGKSWIDNATLMLRLNFAALLFDKAAINFKVQDDPKAMGSSKALKRLSIKASLQPLLSAFGALPVQALGPALADYLLPVKVDLKGSKFQQYVQMATTTEERVQAWTLVLMSMPEYQLI